MLKKLFCIKGSEPNFRKLEMDRLRLTNISDDSLNQSRSLIETNNISYEYLTIQELKEEVENFNYPLYDIHLSIPSLTTSYSISTNTRKNLEKFQIHLLQSLIKLRDDIDNIEAPTWLAYRQEIGNTLMHHAQLIEQIDVHSHAGNQTIMNKRKFIMIAQADINTLIQTITSIASITNNSIDEENGDYEEMQPIASTPTKHLKTKIDKQNSLVNRILRNAVEHIAITENLDQPTEEIFKSISSGMMKRFDNLKEHLISLEVSLHKFSCLNIYGNGDDLARYLLLCDNAANEYFETHRSEKSILIRTFKKDPLFKFFMLSKLLSLFEEEQ